MKKCFKCNKEKPLIDFYKHPEMADGRVNKCKECNKVDVRANRASKLEYYREYDKKRWIEDSDRRDKIYAYLKTEKGKEVSRRSKRRWEANNAIKKGASTMVGNAVRDGKLKKPSKCSECDISGVRIHGHHDDYSKPLTVRWLCSQCHRCWHKEHGEAKNG